MGDLLGPGFFNKPRYRHEVLIGNWYEDRALQDPNFLSHTTTARKPVTVDSVVKDEVRPTSITDNNGLTVNGLGTTSFNKQQTNNNTKDYTINPGDPTRGYYATTYKRSYGPRNGYIHYDTYPTATEDFDRRREAAMHPGSMGSIPQQTTMSSNNNNSGGNNCLRCEQLSKENTECSRCQQLAGL